MDLSNHAMKTVLIITHIDFWAGGAGHRSRLSSMLNYLKDRFNITIVFVGVVTEYDEETIKKLYNNISLKFEVLEKNTPLSIRQYAERFDNFMNDKFFDAAIIEYVELSFMINYISDKTITILDTHDIVTDRIHSFKRSNLPYHGIILNEDEEIGIFKLFDYVIAIQTSDYNKLSAILGKDQTLLIPHCTFFSDRKPITKEVSKLGYVASEYLPNVDALQMFINEIWPSLHHKYKDELTFHVFGNVRARLNIDTVLHTPACVFHGFVPELESIYNCCDIIINPVRCGAGLKIKNVEALSKGLPLVTSPEGALGMEDGIDSAFLVAHNSDHYRSLIQLLIEDFNFRKILCNNAYEYYLNNFSEEMCYKPLLNIIS